MLDPQDRQLLLDALRPDPGAVLDRAVGTTFTLDLETLLLAPLAFAMFETDGATPDPTALLAAIQQHAANLALYCDASHVRAPSLERKLYVLLEPALLPVHAPNGGAFHPKLWVLRYRYLDGTRQHRVLVLSRNQTFDTSWDLVVRFDEDPDGAPFGTGVARVLEGLDALRPSAITQSVRDSVSQARFAIPGPFTSAKLHGVGLARSSATDPISTTDGDRVLVVSPFLTAGRLQELERLGARRTLVSRPDELVRVGGAGLKRWGVPLVLRQPTADPDEAVGEAPAAEPLDGLHAKLYVTDRGETATWFAGSANATHSSLRRNVETIIEMEGPTAKVGVGALLSLSGKELRFRSMLQEFPILEEDPSGATPEDDEEARLEVLARAISRLPLTATVHQRDTGFQVELTFAGEAPELDPGDHLHARLVSRSLQAPCDLTSATIATLDAPRASEITALIAFRLTGDRKLAPARQFVLAATLVNAPEDRIDRLLVDLIPDRRRFALLVFLMLAAGDPENDAAATARHLMANSDHDVAADRVMDIPLFESLVRTSARDPERLTAIDKLVTILAKTPEGRDRLPEGFDELWGAFRHLVRRSSA